MQSEPAEPEPRQLVVVRHGQSTWNVEHRFTGQADPPLSPLGQVQARDLAARCAGLALDAVVTSDLVRAAATGRTVTRALGLPDPITLPDLRERANSAWTGQSAAEIEAQYPGDLAAWREARALSFLGPYEDYDGFADRVTTGLATAAQAGARTLVVAHAGIFVVLDQLSGETTAGHVGNAEGRIVTVAAIPGRNARALSVGAAVRIDPSRRSGLLDP